MKYNVGVIREHGARYWLAWKLVQVAHRVKDTTYWQVIRIPGRSAVLVEADTWGSGVSAAFGVHWGDDDPVEGWPVLRDFDGHEAALDWMHGESA
ncbi:hypothetical protein [Nocardia flavorosea]|uniref:Uncharacterized protein n=1 Tax=Nocardia flavorosea TaxID=53429 RepID=A0A846YSC2_9NOCA|nr:hypothetical protein [Nocardia flavorosea]NKY60450.1 hypothetical protein [Nocardia flavorosea]